MPPKELLAANQDENLSSLLTRPNHAITNPAES